ncbi:hypothetical protein A1F99_052610 [Pyrenophora tritici-repentis]|nr:hypothetical protein A1F99_052610 [Pyrenophora tritici-repentis]
MNTMDMTSSPVLTKSILEPYNPVIQDPTQSPLIDLHPFMIAQAFFVAETYRLLPEIYELLWQTLYKLQSQEQMARQSRPAATHGRRRGAPSPDPEPAAPPYVHPPSARYLSIKRKSHINAPSFPPPTIHHHQRPT